jgi:hypothetical protein
MRKPKKRFCNIKIYLKYLMKDKNQPLDTAKKAFVFTFPIFFLLFCLFLYIEFHNSFYWFLQEDGVVEYSQAIFYFSAGIIALLIARKLKRNKISKWLVYAYYLFSGGLFFVAFEEISWGQRIFGLTTPEFIMEHNVQSELTIHNLEPFQAMLHKAYMAVGLYGAFAWFVIPKKMKILHQRTVGLLAARPLLFLYFFPVFLYYAYYDFIYVKTPSLYEVIPNLWQWQEAFELLLSLAFLLFTYKNLKISDHREVHV